MKSQLYIRSARTQTRLDSNAMMVLTMHPTTTDAANVHGMQ